jgi:hypothetical protein
MNLHRDWRTILRRAWSIRFIALGGLCSAVAVSLPIAQPYINADPLLIACATGAATFLACLLAGISRIIVQKDVP